MNNQRWKFVRTQGIVDIKRPDTPPPPTPPPPFHIQEKTVIQLNKLAALHSYQKMAHSSWTKDGQWSDRGTHVMETFFVSYYVAVMMEMEKVKGGFAGTPASMCSV